MNEQTLKNEIDYFNYNIIEFGSLDIRTAVETAIDVNEGGDYVADCVREFAESTGTPLMDCDIVACVYDEILQHARNEIDELTKFDFCNDGAEIWTAGNYMATSYDWRDNAPNTIKEILDDNNIKLDDLTVKTQWFLEQIDVELA